MDTRKRSLFWSGLIVIFLLALLPRLFYPVSQRAVWYPRSAVFWEALRTGDLKNTYQRYHPGVTTMWIAGAGMRLYMTTHNWSYDKLLDPPHLMSGSQGPPAQAGVAAISLVITICIVLAYVLLNRLTSWPVAFGAGFFLALDPFYLVQCKMIHVDGLLATFMLVSVLFLLTHLKEKRWSHLVISGMFGGLALLTKSPALFLLPYTTLILVLHWLIESHHAPSDSRRLQVWSKRLLRGILSLGIWGCVAVGIFFALWPAMWVAPGETLWRIQDAATYHIGSAHAWQNFFAGRITKDPGALYYPASLAWKMTLVTLPATVTAILLLIRLSVRRVCKTECKLLWYMLIYAAGFVLAMTMGAKKWARYILPTFLALDILAAWGLVQIGEAIGKKSKRRWIPTAVVAIALIIQAITVLRHHPYYGTHHNLLLGGSRVAQHVLHLGDQGEGLDLAAKFMNERPGAPLLTVGVRPESEGMFSQNFVGRVKPIEDTAVDYRVFFINDKQRKLGYDSWGDKWEAHQRTEPIWTQSFDGVTYVWIYPAYPMDPAAFAIDHRLDARLGDHIQLLGYNLSADQIAPGNALTVTLFWQSDASMVEDYHVFVHLMNVDQKMIAQHDGVPVQGERPTWSWQEMQVLEDKHTLVPTDTLAGVYTISVGLYDSATQIRLPAFGATGTRLLDDRIELQDIVIKSP